MALRATNLPVHVGSCRCGRPRGHMDPCFNDPPHVELEVRPTRTPWHDMRDELVDEFGEEMGNWLARRAGKELKGKLCISNFSIVELPTGLKRLSPAAHEAVGRHKHIRSSGCCGSVDVEFHHYRSGRRFAFGFNHGH